MLRLALVLTALGLIASATLIAESTVPLQFSRAEEFVAAGKWSKAGKALRNEMVRAVESGGVITPAHLMHAVRMRAVIEAGRGNPDAANWWWHAGLNLQAQGAESFLNSVAPEIAATLRAVEVRPRRVREGEEPLPKLKPGDRPTEFDRGPVFSAADARFKGYVKFDVELGPRGEFRRPLILETTVPLAVLYSALDHQEKNRFPVAWRKWPTATFVVSFGGVRHRGGT